MPFTHTQLAAMEAAYASGVSRVTYEGRTVEYRDLEALAEAIRQVRREIEAAEKGEPRPRSTLTSFSRG